MNRQDFLLNVPKALWEPVQEGSSLHLSFFCFGQIPPGVRQLGLQFRAEDDLLVEAGNIVLMVFWITVTVPLDNIYEEKIYSCTTLSVLTLLTIVLVTTSAITTAATIYLLPDPLFFSKTYFFADIPVLLFAPPATSFLRS